MNAELTVEPNTTAGFKIAQKKDANNKTIDETVIGYDAAIINCMLTEQMWWQIK